MSKIFLRRHFGQFKRLSLYVYRESLLIAYQRTNV